MIVKELFLEMEFNIQNILICQHNITKAYCIYFSGTKILKIVFRLRNDSVFKML